MWCHPPGWHRCWSNWFSKPCPAKENLPWPIRFNTLPDVVNKDMTEQVKDEKRGRITVFNCPECGGSLWQVNETNQVRFRCHVGHALQAETLLAEQASALEAALWTAVRTFKERHLLALQLSQRERARGDQTAADRYEEQAQQADRYGRLIQQLILNGPPAREEKA